LTKYSLLSRYAGGMFVDGQSFYPGETATAQQVLLLANEYRAAADALYPVGRRGAPLSRAPFRFVATHAVELYLNALLLDAGYPPERVRGFQHDLASRTRHAAGARLILRQRTERHLESLFEDREYLASRYDPTRAARSELNRLQATLKEVSGKVNLLVGRSAGRPR
jgi:hypothetical protein